MALDTMEKPSFIFSQIHIFSQFFILIQIIKGSGGRSGKLGWLHLGPPYLRKMSRFRR